MPFVDRSSPGLLQLAGLDICGFLPFILAAMLSMMSLTSVSVSMERRNWWILKSMPLCAREIRDAKLLHLNLSGAMYLFSQIFLFAALRPGRPSLLWQIPGLLCFLLFSSVFALTVNLRLAVLDWQSASSRRLCTLHCRRGSA